MHTLLFISELNAKKLSVLIAVFIIAAALFLALSRGAFVAFIIASLTTFWCFGIARKPENTVTLLVATVGVVFFVVGWLTIGQQLLDRFNQHSAENIVTQEARFQNWKETSPAVLDYGLLGSGTGSYHSVHRLYRDDTEKVIFEHAENQYFQTAVENGWLGFLLLLLAIGTAWASASFVLNRGTSSTTIAVGLMGIFVLASQAVCAFFDFGMMIPSNLVLMASLCGIVSAQAHALGGRLKKKNIFQRGANKFLVQLFLFILLLSSCWHALSAWRLIEIETITAENPIRDFSPAVNQDETQKEFEETSQLIRATRSAKAYLHRARLTLHQYRLKRYPIDKQEFEKRISLYQAALANKKRFAAQLVEKKITTEANAPMVLDALVALVSQDASPQELDQKIVELTKLSDDQLSQFKLDLIKIREDVITEITFNQFLRAITSKAGAEYKELHDRLLIDGVEAVEPVQSFVWSMSNPRSFHLWLHQLEAEDPILHSRTLASFAVQGEIKDARQDLLQSIQRSPLDPAAHLLLLQLQAGTDSKEVEHEMAERMIALAPKNSEARNYAGLFALQAGQPHQACEHWHEYLSLDPRPRRLRGIMNRIRNRMDIESIYRELIPKTEPMLMYLFATEEVRGKDNAAFRDRVLREAYDVLIEEASRDFEPLFLKGRIQKRLGEDDAALSSLLEAQRKKRGNRELIFELAQLQYRMNLLNDAYHNAEFLSRKHPENNHYRRLLKQINEKRIQK